MIVCLNNYLMFNCFNGKQKLMNSSSWDNNEKSILVLNWNDLVDANFFSKTIDLFLPEKEFQFTLQLHDNYEQKECHFH